MKEFISLGETEKGGLGEGTKGESDIVRNITARLTTLCYYFQLFTALLFHLGLSVLLTKIQGVVGFGGQEKA